MDMGTKSRKPFSILTSILWTPENGFFLLDRHLQRLAESAAYFSFAFSRPVVQHFLHHLTKGLTTPHKVRITIDRKGNPAGDVLPLTLDDRPVRVTLAAQPVDPANPFLYHKTTNRQVYDRAWAARLEPPDAVDDVILWNANGEITESTIANVVVDREGNLYTPPVSCGLLPGVFRAHLLDQGIIQEKVISLADYHSAGKVHLINSVRKWRICRIIERR